MTENTDKTSMAKQDGRRKSPWIMLTAVLAAVIVAMAFGMGYLVADNKAMRSNNNQTQDSAQQQPTADMKQLAESMNGATGKPSRVTEQGGILISKNGYGKKMKGAPTISVYEEPLCPYCGQLNRKIDPILTRLMKAGQINIDVHLVNFLDQASSDGYSNRAANGALYILDHDDDPEHLLAYLANIYAEDFQPNEGNAYQPVGNDKLKEQAIKAGVSQDVADKAFDGKLEYQTWLDAATAYTTNLTDLYGTQGGFSTPTVTINGNLWSIEAIMSQGADANTELLKSIGLDQAQAGETGTLPSIGAKGKPLS
ncbi:DsbA family protein [Bifidobacterium miconisargentati]|uniref:DsbA family protein n=1 Tax=Bifidobacterium miconisargentati TaxID=2834437 RepID=UPI001BDCC76C|nr:thioredoxin domain-containing protein [Bifidobacterium miconisargentati]MBW3089235.1 thioredoxin domain-containing protein [Bifidobacterium miconisargentati]